MSKKKKQKNLIEHKRIDFSSAKNQIKSLSSKIKLMDSYNSTTNSSKSIDGNLIESKNFLKNSKVEKEYKNFSLTDEEIKITTTTLTKTTEKPTSTMFLTTKLLNLTNLLHSINNGKHLIKQNERKHRKHKILMSTEVCNLFF